MSVYRLLWELLKHVLRGRGRDEVTLLIYLVDYDGAVATSEAVEFDWAGSPDTFCVISGKGRVE